MVEINQLVKESIDLHYHIGPDILPRRDTVETLVVSERGKIKGIALKSHAFPTISTINTIKKREDDPLLIGSITLNYFMGGFNPSAIYASACISNNLYYQHYKEKRGRSAPDWFNHFKLFHGRIQSKCNIRFSNNV